MNKIIINNKEFIYTPMDLSYETSAVLDLHIAKENLLLFKHVAEKNAFSFLLFYGTLLGAIRENNFIKHDIDIDLITSDESKLLEIIPVLQKHGFLFIRYETNKSLKSFSTIYSFMRKTVYIDVYIAYKEKKKYNLLGSYIPYNFIEKTIIISFLDENFEIPKYHLEILLRLYGKDWKTPYINKPGDFKPSKTINEKVLSIIRKIIPKKCKEKLKLFINFKK